MANLLFFRFPWARYDACQKYVLRAEADIFRKVEIYQGNDTDRVVVPTLSCAIRIEKICLYDEC
jgi:hypothetical protein